MSDLRELLIDPGENIEAVLGNNFAQTYLTTGTIGNGFAILSDKRVYFKGKCLYKSGKRYYASAEEKVLDLNDVTGSGFVKVNPVYLLVTGIILGVVFLILLFISISTTVHAVPEHFVPNTGDNPILAIIRILFIFAPLVFSVVLIVSYYLRKRSIFKIDYAGGSVGFDLRLISYSEAEQFNRSLRTCKDNAIKRSQTMFAAVTVPPQQSYPSSAVSTAEELTKYNELLAKGVITQADYDAKKKQLLGL